MVLLGIHQEIEHVFFEEGFKWSGNNIQKFLPSDIVVFLGGGVFLESGESFKIFLHEEHFAFWGLDTNENSADFNRFPKLKNWEEFLKYGTCNS